MMKKLFFFRSSGSGSGNNNSVSHPSTDKQVYWEKVTDTDTRPCLRRSFSFSSAASHDGALGQRNGSPSRSSNVPLKRSNRHSSRYRTFTPERQSKEKCFEAVAIKNAHAVEKPGSTTSSASLNDSSEGSSNVSNKVLDRYIDGEQQQERSLPKCNYYERNHIGNGNSGGKYPRQVQYTAPASPTDSVKGKPRSHSFREAKGGTHHHFSSGDSVGNGFEQESPRRLAKHVIERLTQSRVLPKTSSKELNSDVPITIEDIYGGPLNGCPSLNSDRVLRNSSLLDGQNRTTNGYHHKEISGFQKRNCFPIDNCGDLNSFEIVEDSDVDLLRKSKEAEKRFMVLSEELEQENFLQDSGFSVPALIQTIRNLTEEKVSMALEVSSILRDRVAERASTKEEIRLVRVELDSRTRRLEKEKNELQLALEKELDRRSSDWSVKLEKYQAEEHRLRERVRELAEQNVSLQKEVSFFSEREMETSSRITYSELQLKDLTTSLDETREENQNLKQDFSDIQEKYKAAEEDRDCIRRNYEEKEKERKQLHKSITRLLRTCSEQEKTIDGLRKGLSHEIKKGSLENFDKQLGKLQMEQMRLTGVEQALRKEVESYRLEVDSLRHENINLLQRLKGSGNEGGFSIFKLDQELQNRVCCLQNQGLTLLNENTQLCSKLLDHIKEKTTQIPETNQGTEVITNGFDDQFIVEADMKVQGFKRGTESLRRSLQTISGLLHEKSNLVILESHSHSLVDESGWLNSKSVEDTIKSELKAETLLTSLLREKLYSKELDVEQLQAELAAAVRGTDILRCEVQNALDSLSCVTHKMKDLELQMIKKDENTNRLQDDLQEYTRELSIMRETLPRVSQERDLMWEEVKQYSEKNMLLNSENNVLKKKIEALDEDVLLKEGQITILKDTLGKPFDLIGTPDFRLQ
ncbi:uncharacterized protein LOC132271011 [Cornus florida]|uniref:uncharacterized protein LOC132271011 n=1 Tax=Cornus florida TaxID=4283 RepID=UPI00289F0698|nr:uncharacterized protein LOC132271011 [Cornus florida]